jgi:hypothetical protein
MPLAILILLLVLFFECQEKIYSKNESPSLVSTNLFSIEECKKNINILRYFGPSTLIIYIIIVILFWKKI